MTMKINTAYYLTSARKPADFPATGQPEFAFMGRSNVGKSSLINMLTGRKGLVKVGANPGVTRAINFFIINDEIALADLPGFGYAKLPMELRKSFLPMIKTYIRGRESLRLVFMLIDIRRVPDSFEKDIITILSEKQIPVAIIATKCDKLTRNQRAAGARKIAESLSIDGDSLFFSSSKTGEGKKDLLKLIEEYGKQA